MLNIKGIFMDIGKVFPGGTISKRRGRSFVLSYRRFAHLKVSQKKKYEKFALGYSIPVRQLALWMAKYQGKSLRRRFFRIAQKIHDSKEYQEFITKYFYEFSANGIPDRYLYKELIFQGFVDINSIKLNPRYGYFMINRLIEGVLFVYPKKFSDNYSTLRKGKYPYFQDYMGLYGIPGITRYSSSSDTKRHTRSYNQINLWK